MGMLSDFQISANLPAYKDGISELAAMMLFISPGVIVTTVDGLTRPALRGLVI
jgi:hypothetical protein